MSFTYESGAVPAEYKCKKCGAHGVKLWRQYQTCADAIELLCAPCALHDQNETGPVGEDGLREGEYGRTDQIGWLVPAIPTEDLDTYWGYTSVPAPGVRWWRGLGVTPPETAATTWNRLVGSV